MDIYLYIYILKKNKINKQLEDSFQNILFARLQKITLIVMMFIIQKIILWFIKELIFYFIWIIKYNIFSVIVLKEFFVFDNINKDNYYIFFILNRYKYMKNNKIIW